MLVRPETTKFKKGKTYHAVTNTFCHTDLSVLQLALSPKLSLGHFVRASPKPS